MAVSEKWVLWECGFNQLAFEDGTVNASVRELVSFSVKPILVLASCSWDACHLYVKVKGEVRPLTKTTGRWKQVVDALNGQLGGEVVKELTEIGSVVIAKTDHDRIVGVSGEMMDLVVDQSGERPLATGEKPLTTDQSGMRPLATNQSAKLIDSLYHISLGTYVKLNDGHMYRGAVNTDSALEIDRLVLLGIPIQQVSCGSDHMLLLGSGRVWSYGLNHRGQLGLGDLQTRLDPVIVEALDGVPFGDISCGNWHNLALSQFGDVYSWGWNADGQLGHSADTATIAIPTLLNMGHREVDFKHVQCGARHSAAVSRCGLLFTWGWNGYQQLGHHDCPGPAQVSTGAEVVWLHCAPWSTLFLTHHRPS